MAQGLFPAHSGGKVVVSMTFSALLWIFFCYSFLGWALETADAAVKHRRYVDRSVLYGPLCVCYGVTAVVLAVGL